MITTHFRRYITGISLRYKTPKQATVSVFLYISGDKSLCNIKVEYMSNAAENIKDTKEQIHRAFTRGKTNGYHSRNDTLRKMY